MKNKNYSTPKHMKGLEFLGFSRLVSEPAFWGECFSKGILKNCQNCPGMDLLLAKSALV